MNIIKKLFFNILLIQEKFLKLRLQKTLSANKVYTKRKKIYQTGCLLSFDAIADNEKNHLEEELFLILKSCNFNPIELIEYIKKQNSKVYYIKNQKTLHAIGENEGFIYPQSGIKAIYLSLITKNHLSLNTPEMFVLTNNNINTYFFIYHFYNWFTYKKGISGIDTQSQNLLNKYLFNSTDEDINKLQLEEIYKLKNAIKQDKAAIEFVFKLCQKYDGAKKALNRLKDSGANL